MTIKMVTVLVNMVWKVEFTDMYVEGTATLKNSEMLQILRHTILVLTFKKEKINITI